MDLLALIGLGLVILMWAAVFSVSIILRVLEKGWEENDRD